MPKSNKLRVLVSCSPATVNRLPNRRPHRVYEVFHYPILSDSFLFTSPNSQTPHVAYSPRYTDSGLLATQSGNLGQAARDIAAAIVLALSLGTVDALLRCEVADGLQEATLADLPGDEVVYAVLKRVDLLNARHFGLVECVCRNLMSASDYS